MMVAYPWPGNVRELRNTIEYAFVLARGKSIGPEHLPEKIAVAKTCLPESLNDPGSVVRVGLSEKEMLLDALQKADGNQSRAAQSLGVSRVTVWKRIKKYGIQLK
jgi:transcriptional regulator of acetoin/glycerol metabolism